MGSGGDTESTSVTTTPAPTQQEIEAQGMSNAINKTNLYESGYEQFREGEITDPTERAALQQEYDQRYAASIESGQPDPELNPLAAKLGHGPQAGAVSVRKRALTEEETLQNTRNKEIEEIAFRKLKGEVTPQEQALLDESYGAAITTGKSDLNAEFQRLFEQLGIGEGRLYEDINQASREGAAERGLAFGDTPIAGERQKSMVRLGEDVSRNKRLLGEDFVRNLADLETNLRGAKAGATMNVMGSGQLFAQGLAEFQAGLRQQSTINRQMISDSYNQTALGLGQLRSRNTTTNSTGSGGGAGGAGIAGGALSGAASGAMTGMAAGPWGALIGAGVGALAGGLSSSSRR